MAWLSGTVDKLADTISGEVDSLIDSISLDPHFARFYDLIEKQGIPFYTDCSRGGGKSSLAFCDISTKAAGLPELER